MKSLLTIPVLTAPFPVVSQADACEVWLDRFQGKIPKTKKKIVLVCKDKRENGFFTGSSAGKIDRILRAGGADFVDVGLQTNAREIKRLKKGIGKTKLILSFHDFEKTPSEKRLWAIVHKAKKQGADVVKIATLVKKLEDNEVLITLALELSEKRIPHIIIGMGELGVVTRLFSKEMGNVLTFVAGEEKTAEGQLSASDMKEIAQLFNC